MLEWQFETFFFGIVDIQEVLVIRAFLEYTHFMFNFLSSNRVEVIFNFENLRLLELGKTFKVN